MIDRIPPELQEFYHDGATSLSMYTDSMEQEIAKRNFFNTNKSLAEKTDGTIDVDGSVGNLVAQLVKNNQINYDLGINLVSRQSLISYFKVTNRNIFDVLKTIRHPSKLNILVSLNFIFLDGIGQVSPELISMLDIIQ